MLVEYMIVPLVGMVLCPYTLIYLWELMGDLGIDSLAAWSNGSSLVIDDYEVSVNKTSSHAKVSIINRIG